MLDVPQKEFRMGSWLFFPSFIVWTNPAEPSNCQSVIAEAFESIAVSRNNSSEVDAQGSVGTTVNEALSRTRRIG